MLKVYVVPKDDSVKERVKAWCKNRMTDAKCLWNEHKTEILIFGPPLVTALGYGIKAVSKYVNTERGEYVKECRVYDARLGFYWRLKHELDNNQKLEVKRRVGAGEALGDVLESMKVLK